MMQGLRTTGTILDRILEAKREEIAHSQLMRPFEQIRLAAQHTPLPPSFWSIFQMDSIALIAEVKRASPSRGILIDPFLPVEIASNYVQEGAMAISVLTDEPFFGGHLAHLKTIHQALPHTPLLRKDFTLSAYQVYEARAAGASAILLIVAALESALLADLHSLAEELGLAALVEVHDEAELETALHIKARLVGVNNRDLRDFSVDLSLTRRLAAHVPSGVYLVGESGIKSAEDVRALGPVDAILVGGKCGHGQRPRPKTARAFRLAQNAGAVKA
jgi:indole-3-glycerol phosphate synthase